MGRVLFKLDPVQDPLEQAVESTIQEPVRQDPTAPVPGGRVLFQMEPEPETDPTITETIGRGLRGEGELALTMGTFLVAQPIAGIAGIVQGLNPFAEPGAAASAVETIMGLTFKPGPAGQEIAKGIGEIAETLTPDALIELATFATQEYKELNEEVFQKYGPLAATAMAIAPEAALELTAGYATIKQLRNMGRTRADEAIQQTEDALRNRNVDSFRTDIQPEDKTLKQIANDFGKQNTQNLIEAVQSDPVRLQAAKDLGIDTNPSHFSNNQAFIAMEQGLKSKPGNELRQRENLAIEKLGERADELIIKMEGEVEKGLLDAVVKKEFQTVIADLEVRASKDYNVVNQAIDPGIPVVPATSRLYIEKRLSDLGGDAGLLNKSEKQLARITGLPKKEIVSPDVGEVELPTPSYGALDQVRRNVGDAIEKKSGPYRDDEEGILNQIYGVLSNDQQGVADALGVGPVYERARKLVRVRKDIEKKSTDLFGRELKGSLIPKLATSAKNIVRGDVNAFKRLMDTLPPSQRQAAASTFLNDLFSFNARSGGKLGGGFATAFQSLKNNPSVKKIIFDQLPPEALKTFNDIGEVTVGLFRAKALQNQSGTANALLANLDNGAIANKILKSRRLLSPFSKEGRLLAFSAAFLKRTLPKRTEISADLLTSPEFKRSLEDAALGKSVSAENITKTQKFKKWFNLQNPPDQKQIATIGFIPWLLQDEEPEIVIEVSTEELRRRNQ